MLKWVFMIFVIKSFSAEASNVRTVSGGDWENPNVWSGNQIPINPDTLFIAHYITVNQNFSINAPTVLFVEAGGTICGEYLMETLCGTYFINYGQVYLNQLKVKSGTNYNVIKCKTAVILSGCPTGSFYSLPPNGQIDVWPPVLCKTPATNYLIAGVVTLQNNLLTVFPNPVTTNDHISLRGDGQFEVTLKDVFGTCLTSLNFRDTTLIETYNLPAGIYFLEIKQNGRVQISKIVKPL